MTHFLSTLLGPAYKLENMANKRATQSLKPAQLTNYGTKLNLRR